jgi:hypothetical protein
VVPRLVVLVVVLALFLGCGACSRRTEPAKPDPAPDAAPAPVALPVASVANDAAASSGVTPLASAAPRTLRFVTQNHRDGSSACSVVDDASGAVVGRTTSKNTAAGGSNVVCFDFLADGKIIRFTNSRGVYAKDARPHAKDDQTLPCGDGAFANDVSSCVELDKSPQWYSEREATAEAAPFEVELCAVATGACTTLVTIPRGLNRFGAPGGDVPRWWDARYCSDDRVLVVGEGVLRLFEAPSGKHLADAPAPGAVRITDCEGGVAHTRSAKSSATLSFAVQRSAITSGARR